MFSCVMFDRVMFNSVMTGREMLYSVMFDRGRKYGSKRGMVPAGRRAAGI